MKKYLELLKPLLYLFLFLIPLHNFAQDQSTSAARINNIATYSDGELGEIKFSTSRVQLKRSNQNNWLDVKRNDDLYFNDILKLDKDIWLRVGIKNKIQKVNFSLSNNQENVNDTLLNKPARYKIIENKLNPGLTTLEILEGNAVVNVFKNFISTITDGILSVARSGSTTRVLYVVRSDNTGEIYLQQGHLTFPGNTEVPGLNEGQVAYFQNGQIINVFFPNVPMTTQYNDLIKYNNNTVWKKPFLKQPVTWIGAAVVGIGTVLIITKPWDKKVNVTVKINMGGN